MLIGWSEIRKTFPDSVIAGQTRILELVRAGNYVPFTWHEVRVKDAAANVARFSVAGDALKLGVPGDSVRANVSHATAQVIADWLGWSTMTPLLMDQTVREAKRDGVYINSQPLTAGFLWGVEGAPTDKLHMELHSQAIDARAKGATLIAGPWKQWVSSSRLRQPFALKLQWGTKSGIQYGFFQDNQTFPRSVSGLHLYQQPSSAHPVSYSDYSEKFRPVARWVVLEMQGQEPAVIDIYDLAADPATAHFVNHDGAINMHHPFLPVCAPLPEGGACGVSPGGGGGKPDPGTPPPGGSLVASRYQWGRLVPLGAATGVALLWSYLYGV